MKDITIKANLRYCLFNESDSFYMEGIVLVTDI